MDEKNKSVYVVGAEDGLLVGPIMAAAAVFTGVSTYQAWASIPALVCMLAVPVVVYWLLGREAKRQPVTPTFPALWLQGICTFFFGGVIMAAVVMACLHWWAPDFMHHVVTQVVEAYQGIDDPAAASLAETLRKVEKSGALPSAMDVALELVYAAVFSGSLLSMVYALVVRRLARRLPPKFR